RIGDGIGVGDPHQREQPSIDLADDLTIYAHARVADALQYRPHQLSAPASPDPAAPPRPSALPAGSNAGCTAPTGSPCPSTGTRSQSHCPWTPRARSAPASS